MEVGTLWEGKDATAAAADGGGFSDSGTIKRLIRGGEGQRLEGRSRFSRVQPRGAGVPWVLLLLHHCSSCPIRLLRLEYKSHPSFCS